MTYYRNCVKTRYAMRRDSQGRRVYIQSGNIHGGRRTSPTSRVCLISVYMPFQDLAGVSCALSVCITPVNPLPSACIPPWRGPHAPHTSNVQYCFYVRPSPFICLLLGLPYPSPFKTPNHCTPHVIYLSAQSPSVISPLCKPSLRVHISHIIHCRIYPSAVSSLYVSCHCMYVLYE